MHERVWESVKGLLAAAGNARKQIVKKQAAAERNNSGMVKKLADLQKKKAKCEAERFTNMDQLMAGSLDKEVYQKRRSELTQEKERLDGLIADLEVKLVEFGERDPEKRCSRNRCEDGTGELRPLVGGVYLERLRPCHGGNEKGQRQQNGGIHGKYSGPLIFFRSQ